MVAQELVTMKAVSFALSQQQIIDRVNLTLPAGKIVSIIGPNGAGKTTLIKLVVGLLTPSAGRIHRVNNLRVGYMPQRLQIDPIFPITVKRFLQLGQKNAQLEEVLAEIAIKKSMLNSQLSMISGGELQRVLLARALLRRPQLLVLDEPAQGIDLMGQSELYSLIARIRDQHQCAILLVSHDLNVVMAQTDTVVCLNQHICCVGHPEKVSRDPAFQALFGKVAASLAFYTHHHDHQHDSED